MGKSTKMSSGAFHETGSLVTGGPGDLGLQMFVNYKDGTSRSGLIVGLDGTVMRVALQGCEDLVEFRLVDNVWTADECEVVSFDFPPGIAQHDSFRIELAKAVHPIRRLPGYLGADERITGAVN
jgi:hypothetical protein